VARLKLKSMKIVQGLVQPRSAGKLVKKYEFEFRGERIPAGTSKVVELPLMRLYTNSKISVPVKVLVGKRSGPTVFLSAAIHGDEVNGVEIIRRIIKHPALKRLRGTILAVPVVNVHGLLAQSRYLPDRRDLNRAFPGSETGSLASRVAHLFMDSIVAISEFGIDFHTGSNNRTNLPQVRANLDDPVTEALAKSFGAPVIIDADIRDGSLRAAMDAQSKPILLFEGGEALRFDEVVIRAAIKGTIASLRHIGSLPKVTVSKSRVEPFVARSSVWVRASESGLFRAHSKLGARVKKGELLGYLSDPFGDIETPVLASVTGVIIGRLNLPLANEGEALFHIARFEKSLRVEQVVEKYRAELEPDENDDDSKDPPLV
jgi:predicted deacylase